MSITVLYLATVLLGFLTAVMAVAYLVRDESTAFAYHSSRFAKSAAKRLRGNAGATAASSGAGDSGNSGDDDIDFLRNYTQNQGNGQGQGSSSSPRHSSTRN